MQAGKLRYRCVLRRAQKIRGPTGGWVESWVEVASVWADIRPISGRAWLAAAKEQAEVTAEIFIRFRGDVEAGMRVICKEVAYEVVAPLPDARCQYLKLMCKSAKES